MQNNLKEILELLKENFTRTNEKVFIKLIFSLKSRETIYWNSNIWLSRKEYLDYWVSETQLQEIIMFLRDYWIIQKVWTRKINSKSSEKFKYCNIYKIADYFLEMLKELEFFSKKVFEYINPIVFMQKYFKFTFKYWLYKFKHNWLHYIINTKWKYRNKLLCCEDRKIINPLSLIT